MGALRPPEVIAVHNAKGGTGKTTTVINLADCLHSLGNKVLVVDVDTQANLSRFFGAEMDNVGTVYDIYVSPSLTYESVRDSIEGSEIADVLRGDKSLVQVEKQANSIDCVEWRLADAIGMVKDDYDFVLIDCPPSHGVFTLSALIAADWVIVPFEAGEWSLEGYETQVANLVWRVKSNPRFNPDLRVLGLLMNRWEPNLRISKAFLKALEGAAEETGQSVFASKIRKNVAVAEASDVCTPLSRYSPNCKAAEDFRALAEEVLSRIDDPRTADAEMKEERNG